MTECIADTLQLNTKFGAAASHLGGWRQRCGGQSAQGGALRPARDTSVNETTVQLGQQLQGSTASFAVGSKYGPRSRKWNVIVRGHDVYINTDELASMWHVSLHKSGEHHVRHDFGGQPTYLQSVDDALPPGSYRVGFYIVVPDSCLRPASTPDRMPEPSLWVERPSYDGIIEASVMVWDSRGYKEEWPGRSVGTQLLLAYKLSEYKVILVMWRALAADHPVSLLWRQWRETQFKGVQPIVLDSPRRSGVTGGVTAYGELFAVEWAID